MKTSKFLFSIIWAMLTIALLACALWYGQKYFEIYVQQISEKRERVQFLEKNKQSFDLYKKILVKDSAEQGEIKKFVLSDETSFSAISKIESDMQKIGLASREKGGLMSVSPRENAELAALHAREVLVQLEAEGPYQRVDDYIKALTYLPYVSFIEKVEFQFLEKIQTTVSSDGPLVRARIHLVIIETLAPKK